MPRLSGHDHVAKGSTPGHGINLSWSCLPLHTLIPCLSCSWCSGLLNFAKVSLTSQLRQSILYLHTCNQPDTVVSWAPRPQACKHSFNSYRVDGDDASQPHRPGWHPPCWRKMIYLYACIYVVYIPTHTSTYIYIYMHIYNIDIHTYTYTCLRVYESVFILPETGMRSSASKPRRAKQMHYSNKSGCGM